MPKLTRDGLVLLQSCLLHPLHLITLCFQDRFPYSFPQASKWCASH